MSAQGIDPPKVEVFATVGQSFRFVWTERNDFITLALIPIVILAVLGTAIGRPEDALGVDGSIAFAAVGTTWLFLLLNFAVGVFFGVAWHRRFLVPGEGVSLASALSWRPRHTRFLKVSLALIFGPAILILPLAIVLALAGPFGILLLVGLIFGVMLLVIRLSIMLPAAAVDTAMTIDECIGMTRGNTWRLVALFLLITFIASVGDSLLRLALTGIFGEVPGIPGRFVKSFAIEFIAFAAVAVGVSALSSAYLQLLRGHTQMTANVPTTGYNEEDQTDDT